MGKHLRLDRHACCSTLRPLWKMTQPGFFVTNRNTCSEFFFNCRIILHQTGHILIITIAIINYNNSNSNNSNTINNNNSTNNINIFCSLYSYFHIMLNERKNKITQLKVILCKRTIKWESFKLGFKVT